MLSIVAETDDWIVIDKPPHLLIHPSKPDGPRTLWHELRELLAFEMVNGGQISIVNRLDRETSGLTLICKTAQAARHFGILMQHRLIEKAYLAIVSGWPVSDRFEVNAPLLRQGDVRPSPIYLKQCVHPAGAHAVTEVEVLERIDAGVIGRFSIVKAIPHTGRMHQIRVHLAHAGHWLVGDKIYGPDEHCYLRFIETGWTAELERLLFLSRQALHSAVLGVPAEGLRWESPLASDLANWLSKVCPPAVISQ